MEMASSGDTNDSISRRSKKDIEIVTRKFLNTILAVLISCCGCNHNVQVASSPTEIQDPDTVRNIAKQIPPPSWTPDLTVAEQAVKNSPGSLNAQFKLGLALYKAERYVDAIATLKPVAAKLSKSPQTNYFLGCAYLGANDFQQAIDTFEHVANIPNVSSAYKTEVYDYIGHCYFYMYDDVHAEASLRKSLEFDQTNENAQKLLTALHTKAGKKRRSVDQGR